MQQQVVDLVGAVFAREAVQDIIAPTVKQILTTARGEVVSIGFVIWLWSGSSAMSSFVDAITRAHEQYLLRNPVWQRCLAVLLYAVALCRASWRCRSWRSGPDAAGRCSRPSCSPARPVIDESCLPPVIGLVTLVLALTTLYKVALPLEAAVVPGAAGGRCWPPWCS